MSKSNQKAAKRVWFNICSGEYFRFGRPSAEFHPCGDCELWGWLDEAPEWVQERDELEYTDA